MLEKCQNAQERWGGVHQLIDKWLSDRQSLIVRYCSLSASKPLSLHESLGEGIQHFCGALIDYCSEGHFEVYEQLLNEAKEYDDGGVEIAEQLYPKLEEMTGKCVDFNDTYDAHCSFDMLANLPADLSEIGEILEERFQIEDQLIEQLHNIHREQAFTGQEVAS